MEEKLLCYQCDAVSKDISLAIEKEKSQLLTLAAQFVNDYNQLGIGNIDQVKYNQTIEDGISHEGNLLEEAHTKENHEIHVGGSNLSKVRYSYEQLINNDNAKPHYKGIKLYAKDVLITDRTPSIPETFDFDEVIDKNARHYISSPDGLLLVEKAEILASLMNEINDILLRNNKNKISDFSDFDSIIRYDFRFLDPKQLTIIPNLNGIKKVSDKFQ